MFKAVWNNMCRPMICLRFKSESTAMSIGTGKNSYLSNVAFIFLYKNGTTVIADTIAEPAAMIAEIHAVLEYDQWTPSLSICFLAPCTITKISPSYQWTFVYLVLMNHTLFPDFDNLWNLWGYKLLADLDLREDEVHVDEHSEEDGRWQSPECNFVSVFASQNQCSEG